MDIKDCRILIVDDEPDIIELVEEEMDDIGFQTATSSSGNKAIELIPDFKPHIILSDYKMPDGNGRELLHYVKEKMPEVVFFFMSGQTDIPVEELLQEGATAFFGKPFDFEELTNSIQEAAAKI